MSNQRSWVSRSVSIAVGAMVAVVVGGSALPARAEVCNIKVVTDANPDYSDIGSMLHSITDNWPENRDKCWAIWYWNHIARRQTSPMILHGMELTDPIRQFNDYGFTMCSTISGVNCSIWSALGLKARFWDICNHTVCDVEVDGRFQHYDGSLSAMYTLCDGKTIAAVEDVGREGACEASGGRTEAGHVAKYHCLTATSRNGFLTGCDTARSLDQVAGDFLVAGLKYRYYYNNWNLGHRYILNLRDGEVYTRIYRRADLDSPDKVKQSKDGDYAADPNYFVPNNGRDPETPNPRYHIRGNGSRTWAPPLTAEGLRANATGVSGLRAASGGGIEPVEAGKPGEAVFKVEGANVIASMKIRAGLALKSADDSAAVSISTDNGLNWKPVFKSDASNASLSASLRSEVNGAYDVLVKITLLGKASASDAQLKGLIFDTVTMVNSKTQPRLNVGRNTVYVGTGEPTESIVVWPELQNDKYKPYVVEEKNVKTEKKHPEYLAVMFAAQPKEDAYVVFKVDAPSDITRVTYGGRLRARYPKSHVDLLHSFDGGKTWTTTYSLTDNTPPWDVIRYETVSAVPPGTQSVLFKYLWNGGSAADDCGLFNVRMEVNHKAPDSGFKPMDVTFSWKERQADYRLVPRSHTKLVDKVPCTYEINVGGADHPVMESLTVNLKGARADAAYGYSDPSAPDGASASRMGGKDAPAEKWQSRWVTYGRNLAAGKPYTCTETSLTQWGAGDPDGKKLTDGVVGPPEAGGIAMSYGALFDEKHRPVITVDLGKAEKCGAFRIQIGGYPWWDAIRGEIRDKIEVLTSADGTQYASAGFFDFKLRWKDLPANFMWYDDETFTGHDFELVLPQPVEARYVRFAVTPARFLSISEVQVLDFVRYEPFDLKIALPDGKDRTDLARYPMAHTPTKAR